MIERENIGGSCINVGCTPTKVMVECARIANLTRRSEEFGVTTSSVTVNIEKVMERKNSIVNRFRQGVIRGLEHYDNITVFRGEASFLDKNTLKIKTNDDEITMSGEKIFIDTGTSPRKLEIPGIDNISYLNSTRIMELEYIPDHLIIIGSGYIGFEFAQMYRRFGSKVSIIGRSNQILKREDSDASHELQEILEEDGIDFYLNTDTKEILNENNKIRIILERDNEETSILGSHLLIAAGQVPNTESLNLSKVG